MGLDMYLDKRTYIGNTYKKPKEQVKIDVKGVKQERVSGIVERAGYWRKANAIHGWFVDNVQEGKDDCKEYYVSKEDMEKLLALVERVLKASKLVKGKIRNGLRIEKGKETPIIEDGEYIKDPSVAKKLLPVRSGFFFGNYDEETAYDQWYYQDLEDTVKILKEAIADEEGSYYYNSSW